MRKETRLALEIADLRNRVKKAENDDEKAKLVGELLRLEKEVKKLGEKMVKSEQG